jgi:hypothetical protein
MEVELSAEAKDKRLNRLVALTVVVFSVGVGLGNIKDGNIVQGMAQAQANGLDRWNEYQSTRTKLHIVEAARAELAASAEPVRAAPALAKFDAQAAKYTAETPRLASEAKAYTADYDALNVHDDQFDAAEASLSTAISIAAVAALTESMIPLVAAWVFGGFGLFLTLCGFLGWSFHPEVLSRLLG